MCLERSLNEAFDQILTTLGSLDNFGRSRSPSVFLVYAHDKPNAATKYDQCVHHLVTWLQRVGAHIISDRSLVPIVSTRHNGAEAVRDILSIQICLLPLVPGSASKEGSISSVDKVLLCGSDTLQEYFESDIGTRYMDSIRQVCDEGYCQGIHPEQRQDDLRRVMKSFRPTEHAHHVHTELAFLQVRCQRTCAIGHGIIPVALNGNFMEYVPFLEDTAIVLKLKSTTDLLDLQRLFFKVLRHLYTDHEHVVQTFQECHDEINTSVGSSTGDEMGVANRVRIRINKAITMCNERGTFIYREQTRREESRNRAQRIDLDKLPVVMGAAFNSYEDKLDEVIRKRYEDGRLRIERLSGKSLPLECCFINLGIINHTRDSDTQSASDKSDAGELTETVSQFSLPVRLKVNAPVKSRQISLTTLFESRKQKDGTALRPKRVLIWGRAGMGKTTLCKKIVYEVYKNGLWKDLYDRVIWLPLRRLKRIHYRTTVELLQDEFPCLSLGERISEALDHLIQSERTLFLLDGLDEVSLSLEQDSPAERVLYELLSRPHTIITSRPHSTYVFDHQPPDLELETVGFFPQQIEEYLQQVAKETKTGDSTTQEIRSFLHQRPLIRSLASIPIQLDAICYTWNLKAFPRDSATMTSLYVAISQKLWKNSALRLGKTDCDGKLITRQQLDLWTWSYFRQYIEDEGDFLQELAFRGLVEEVIEFSAEDNEILDTSHRIPSDEIIHLAFLRSSDNSVEVDDRTFHFIHLTFQEFFAAQYFVSHWTSNRKLSLYEGTGNGRLSDQSSNSVTPREFMQSRKYIDRFDIFWRFVVGLLQVERNKEHLYRFLDTLESEPMDLVGLGHQRLVIHCLSELHAGENDLHDRIQQLEDCYVQWSVCQSRLTRGSKEEWHRHQTSLILETECSDYILTRLLNNEETEIDVLEALSDRTSMSSKLLDAVIQKFRTSVSEHVQKAAIQIIGQHCSLDKKEKLFNLIEK